MNTGSAVGGTIVPPATAAAGSDAKKPVAVNYMQWATDIGRDKAPLELIACAKSAASGQQDDWRKVRSLLFAYPEMNVSQQDEKTGDTALHCAIAASQYAIGASLAACMLKQDSKAFNITNRAGNLAIDNLQGYEEDQLNIARDYLSAHYQLHQLEHKYAYNKSNPVCPITNNFAFYLLEVLRISRDTNKEKFQSILKVLCQNKFDLLNNGNAHNLYVKAVKEHDRESLVIMLCHSPGFAEKLATHYAGDFTTVLLQLSSSRYDQRLAVTIAIDAFLKANAATLKTIDTQSLLVNAAQFTDPDSMSGWYSTGEPEKVKFLITTLKEKGVVISERDILGALSKLHIAGKLRALVNLRVAALKINPTFRLAPNHAMDMDTLLKLALQYNPDCKASGPVSPADSKAPNHVTVSTGNAEALLAEHITSMTLKPEQLSAVDRVNVYWAAKAILCIPQPQKGRAYQGELIVALCKLNIFVRQEDIEQAFKWVKDDALKIILATHCSASCVDKNAFVAWLINGKNWRDLAHIDTYDISINVETFAMAVQAPVYNNTAKDKAAALKILCGICRPVKSEKEQFVKLLTEIINSGKLELASIMFARGVHLLTEPAELINAYFKKQDALTALDAQDNAAAAASDLKGFGRSMPIVSASESESHHQGFSLGLDGNDGDDPEGSDDESVAAAKADIALAKDNKADSKEDSKSMGIRPVTSLYATVMQCDQAYRDRVMPEESVKCVRTFERIMAEALISREQNLTALRENFLDSKAMPLFQNRRPREFFDFIAPQGKQTYQGKPTSKTWREILDKAQKQAADLIVEKIGKLSKEPLDDKLLSVDFFTWLDEAGLIAASLLADGKKELDATLKQFILRLQHIPADAMLFMLKQDIIAKANNCVQAEQSTLMRPDWGRELRTLISTLEHAGNSASILLAVRNIQNDADIRDTFFSGRAKDLQSYIERTLGKLSFKSAAPQAESAAPATAAPKSRFC